MKRFLAGLLKDRHYWKKEDPDADNSPFPDEYENQEMWKSMQSLLEKTDDNQPLDQFINQLFKILGSNCKIPDPKTELPYQGIHALHYQAINIEHMIEDLERRRLEFRRVPAQTSRLHLLQQLTRIANYLG